MNFTEIKNVLSLELQTILGQRSFSKMSKAYQNSPYQKEEANPTETVDDLMLRDDEAEGDRKTEPHRFVGPRHCFANSGIAERNRTRHQSDH